MVKIRECVRKMSAYVPGESSENPLIVKLNQNENRYPPSPKVEQAIHRALSSLPLYPDSTSSSLRKAAAEVFGVEPGEVMASNGSDEMLCILFNACCDPGDEVAVFNPSYTYYATLAAMHDVGFKLIDFDGEFALPNPINLGKAVMVMLPNPNAPTGTLFSEKEVRRLVESAGDTLVVIDEAYADYAGQTVIPLIREYNNLFVVRTFSKSYSLAGIRAGLGFGNKELMAQLEKVRDFYNLDRLAQAGAEAALRDQAYLKTVCDKIIATRQRTIDSMRALGLKVYDSAANFILFRCGSAARAKAVFTGLREKNVYVRYFSNPGIDDCVRVSVGTDADMDAFLQALQAVVTTL